MLFALNGGTARMEPIGEGFGPGSSPIAPARVHVSPAVHLPRRETWERDDPYRFGPRSARSTFTSSPREPRVALRRAEGASAIARGVDAASRSRWARQGRSGRIVGDFDRWDGRLLPLRAWAHRACGTCSSSGIGSGELYKYEILGTTAPCGLRPPRVSMQVRRDGVARLGPIRLPGPMPPRRECRARRDPSVCGRRAP